MSDDHDEEPVALETGAWERLKGALSDTSSGRRRDEVLASDTRTGAEVGASYEALDRTVELLTGQVDRATYERPMARVVEPADLPEEPVETPEEPVETPGPSVVSERCDRLYEDIVWLFAVNDGEGALISLERMLMLGEPQGDAREFVNTNRDKLLSLYEDYMGPFDRVARLGEVDAHVEMPAGYLDSSPLSQVLDLVNGKLTISEILDQIQVPPLVGCAALKQLHRALVIEFD